MKASKIAWMESQYLFPHHFQQQERYLESLIEQRTKAIADHIWGFNRLSLNQSMLIDGRIGLDHGTGIMPDGCPFDLPLNANLPTPLLINKGIKDRIVYLALPIYQDGARHVATESTEQSNARYIVHSLEVYDYAADTTNREILETAELRFQLLLDSDDLGGFSVLPIARIFEVTQEGAIVLDDSFIPPVVKVSANTLLTEHLSNTIGLIRQRADVLAHRFNEENKDRSASAIADFMLLQMLNRYQPSFEQLQHSGRSHPETLFNLLHSFSGELATFTSKSKRPFKCQPYDHENLAQCFSALCSTVGKQLSVVLEQTALPLPIEKRQFGIYVSRISDRTLLSQARFILAIRAALPSDDLRSYLPAHCKVGSVETIRDLVNNQLTGIGLTPLSTAPREIQYQPGYVYFELDSSTEQWQTLYNAGGFAFHIAGELPELSVEFWAIRGD